MEKMIIHQESCKGCKYCEVNCPKEAVKVTGPINEKGYQTPVVDKEKCILCGICFNVCPDCVYEILKDPSSDN